ncbi:MAG: hypothetical protein KF708_13390 [Pirellulales bacterium]|nr:hypothetical protein [Pirellulales bacterium]
MAATGREVRRQRNKKDHGKSIRRLAMISILKRDTAVSRPPGKFGTEGIGQSARTTLVDFSQRAWESSCAVRVGQAPVPGVLQGFRDRNILPARGEKNNNGRLPVGSRPLFEARRRTLLLPKQSAARRTIRVVCVKR